MDFQGMTFPESVEFLANRAGIPMPEPEKGAVRAALGGSTEDKSVLEKLNRYVGALYQKNLSTKPESHVVKQYLKKRGLSEDVIKEFKLGYSEPGWSDLAGSLKRGRAPLPVAEKLGLIKKKSGGDYFDLFRDRLMFPILSTSGNVLGFGGRSLGDQQPKYINSTDSPLFHKGKTLYGLHVTAKHIRAASEAYVVEGYMDLLALYQHGIQNVVATLGTAFTLDHAKALRKLCTKVIALFDGDEAGQMAADKSLPIFLEAGLFSRYLALPEELDPDDFLRKYGVEEFKKVSGQAPDHFLSLLNRKLSRFKGLPAEKVEILNAFTPILERVTDQRLRILYLQEVADRLDVTIRWVEQQLRKPIAQPIDITKKNIDSKLVPKIPTDESMLVQFMLHKPEYLELITKSGSIEKFVSDEARDLAQKIVEKYCQNPSDFDKLAASLMSLEDIQGVARQVLNHFFSFRELNSGLDEASEQQMIQDCLARVKNRDLDIRKKSLLNSLKLEQDLDSEKLEVFLKIAKEQKGPKAP